MDAPTVARAIFSLLSIDGSADDLIRRMEVVGKPNTVLEVHREVLAEARAAEGRDLPIASLERHASYTAGRRSVAVIQTAESRLYSRFLVQKGVVFD